MKIKIVNKSAFDLPKYETLMSAGMDLRADFTKIDQSITKRGDILFNGGSSLEQHTQSLVLSPGARVIIPTNLYIQLPEGYEAQIRPRSGQSFKKGFILPNSPGTIDADYRGNIGVIIANYTNEEITIGHGERIAQMVINKVEQAEWEEVEDLNETERGKGGFGHTGK